MQITLQGSQCKSALRLLPWLELFLCAVAYIHKGYESGESAFTAAILRKRTHHGTHTTMLHCEVATDAT